MKHEYISYYDIPLNLGRIFEVHAIDYRWQEVFPEYYKLDKIGILLGEPVTCGTHAGDIDDEDTYDYFVYSRYFKQLILFPAPAIYDISDMLINKISIADILRGHYFHLYDVIHSNSADWKRLEYIGKLRGEAFDDWVNEYFCEEEEYELYRQYYFAGDNHEEEYKTSKLLCEIFPV